MPSTGEILIDLLARAGVTTVFGIPGVHTLELYRGLSDSPIRHIAPRHEQGAAFMADGWARVSGEPGVCILIGGPGLTNAITPIAQAYHDSIPLLVISGAVPAAQRDLGEIHDLPDQEGLLAKVTAFSETISDPAQLPAALDRALQVFRSARPRPVHLGLKPSRRTGSRRPRRRRSPMTRQSPGRPRSWARRAGRSCWSAEARAMRVRRRWPSRDSSTPRSG
jgi:acetolactate synthase-1/2/3 large subunit